MRRSAISFFDFFLPRFCPACKGKLLSNQMFVCKECVSLIKRTDNLLLENEYSRKFADQNIINGFKSLFIFEKEGELQKIIHAMKYQNRFLLGKFLGSLLAENYNGIITKWNINYIIPVPLHHLKKADRGYNQAFYIAKGLGKYVKIPVKNNYLKRKKFTQTQTKMNIAERELNVKNAFKIRNRNSVKGKNFLLIDDVITTGATVNECGRVLQNSGANKIYAMSVAIPD